jgi:hypothetical protein
LPRYEAARLVPGSGLGRLPVVSPTRAVASVLVPD